MVKPALPGGKYQRGMMYLVLLLGIALIGGASAVVLQVAQTTQQRLAEEELLSIGNEFHRALQHYAEVTPLGFPNAPETLEELLRDARQPSIQRHLRRIYTDPLTGKKEWGLIRGQDKRIVAIHSLSHTRTFKQENFPKNLSHLGGKDFHDEWLFGSLSSPTPVPQRLQPAW